MNARITLAALLSALVLLGCSGSPKKDDTAKPAKLESFKPTLRIQRVWHASIRGESPKLRLGLVAAVDGEAVYAAGHKGDLVALDLQSGRSLWRRDLKLPLSAGPGAGDGLVVVGSSGGLLIAVSALDGAERWRVSVHSELLSAPLVAAGTVYVRTVDGRLLAFDARDGASRWSADQLVPKLSLRGTGQPLVAGDLVISGFDNGKVMAVTANAGAPAWEVMVGQTRGSTEIQRLNDADGRLLLDGGELYAAGYQGRVVRIEPDTGQIAWARDLSSYRGLAATEDALYVSGSEGDVVKLDRRTGTEQWRQKALARRALSGPAVDGDAIVVGDYDGVLHWLDAQDGHFLARMKVGGRISAAPQRLGNGDLLVFDDEGGVTVLRSRW